MKKRKDGDRVDKDTLGKYNRGKQNRFKVSSYKLKVVTDHFSPVTWPPIFESFSALQNVIAYSISQKAKQARFKCNIPRSFKQ